MLERVTGKVKEIGTEVKKWASENKSELIYWGALTGIIVGAGVLGHRNNKKFETAWRAAKSAHDNQDLDHDFGPYKIMCFMEPITREFIGETMCHEDSMKNFLNVK